SGSMAIKIEHDASGKVTGVVYADSQGKMQLQKARIVAVAGNSIESPRLLLNSASNLFPDGLANSSGQVGRNYMRHMTGSVYATFENPVHMYRGTTMAGIVRDEAAFNPKRGFVGGSMGDDAVIIEGVESEEAKASLYSTVHGAGRLFGRREAKRRFTRVEMDEWLQSRGVTLIGADLD
ncbi:MAG: RtcB family protein, partial [Bradyrhizobium sp.]|nr:RtcB family protein [Bradyrhizobium sp.]